MGEVESEATDALEAETEGLRIFVPGEYNG
jgi:hypothetical protein